MYYYEDGTWDLLESKEEITSPSQVCKACTKVEQISKFVYDFMDYGRE